MRGDLITLAVMIIADLVMFVSIFLMERRAP